MLFVYWSEATCARKCTEHTPQLHAFTPLLQTVPRTHLHKRALIIPCHLLIKFCSSFNSPALSRFDSTFIEIVCPRSTFRHGEEQ